MTKLYQKLIKSSPSEAEVRKGLKKVYSSIPQKPGKRMLMNILSVIDLTSLNTTDSKTSILQFPHLLLGVAAIFFDVGVEYTALGSINDFAAILGLPSPHNYVWFVSGGMVMGYLIGVMFIPKYISQGRALLFSTIAAIVVTIAIMIFPGKISVYLVGLLGLANALLWPAIWPLAIADLGKFTKMGSSLLVTGIIGGAFLPLLFGYIADIASHQTAYVVCLPAYFYIMYYSLSGSKIRTGK